MDDDGNKKAKKMPVLYSSRMKNNGPDDKTRSKSMSKVAESKKQAAITAAKQLKKDTPKKSQEN